MRYIIGLLALSLFACGGAPFSGNADPMTDPTVDMGTDAGSPTAETSTTEHDAGSPAVTPDAATTDPTPQVDAGSPQVDSGNDTPDTGITVVDSGSEMDSGSHADAEAPNGLCIVVDGSLTAPDCLFPNTLCCDSVYTPNTHTCQPWNSSTGCGGR